MSKNKTFISENSAFILLMMATVAVIAWFCLITPTSKYAQVIHPDLSTEEDAPSTIKKHVDDDEDGLFWIKFTVSPPLIAMNHLRLHTWSCVNSMMTDLTEWDLPSEKTRCNNNFGFRLTGTAEALKKTTVWSFAGDNDGRPFGVYLDKDWSDPICIASLGILFSLLSALLYLKLPVETKGLKVFSIAILLGAFFIRFWSTFILSSPQFTLESDMGGYFERGIEMLQGKFDVGQNFQPLGYTLWSMLIRSIGGWELHNWLQVFSSWGVVLLTFLIALEYFNLATAIFSIFVASIHFPQISFTSYHLAETTYSFLLTFSLWYLLRTLQKPTGTKFIFTGVILMVAFYFKGNHAFFIPILCLWLLYRYRAELNRAIKYILGLALGCLIVMTPHLIGTAEVYGKPMAGPSAGALNFVEGKCPWKNNRDNSGMSWMSPLFGQTGEKLQKTWDHPFTDQSFFWKEGLKCVHDNPVVMVTSFRYIYYLFFGNELWPGGFSTQLMSWNHLWRPFYHLLLLPTALIGCSLLMKKNEETQQILMMMLLSVFITVYIFKSEVRFRVPFDAILFLWSGYGLFWIYEKIKVVVFGHHDMIELERALIVDSTPISISNDYVTE